MITIVTVDVRQAGRQATTIDDFYYRGYDLSTFPYPKGVGSRIVAAEFITTRKIIARHTYLLEGGDAIRTVYVFASEEAYHEFDNHPVITKAKSIWEGREWEKTKTVEYCEDFMDLGTL